MRFGRTRGHNYCERINDYIKVTKAAFGAPQKLTRSHRACLSNQNGLHEKAKLTMLGIFYSIEASTWSLGTRRHLNKPSQMSIYTH